ncbi:hypothetical protein MVEN_01474200 [Mycena venus]|uniref:Uncharacterized protein n=1 Tax=Mycena venus TaxID=2733690 RepID=A0A8H6XVI2_9AGAR|nr:hypothetical protein MVEN_01474200 [Mycena venus]
MCAPALFVASFRLELLSAHVKPNNASLFGLGFERRVTHSDTRSFVPPCLLRPSSPSPPPSPPNTTNSTLDPMDTLVLCFSALSLTKSRLELNDDFDAAQPRVKRVKMGSSRPARIPNSSILHRPRPVKRLVLIHPAAVLATTTCTPPPPVATAPGPVAVIIREVVVALRPILSASQERELNCWNALCDKARSDFSQHAPRPGPVTIIIPESREEYAFRMRWDSMCTDHYLSPHAPDRSDPREAASSVDSFSTEVASPSIVAATTTTSVFSPIPVVSTTPTPMSKKAKGKQRAVDPAAASSNKSLKHSAVSSSSALKNVTNGSARVRSKGKSKGKNKDIDDKIDGNAASSSILNHTNDGGNDYNVKVKDNGNSNDEGMSTSGSTSGVKRTQKKDNGGGKALLSWTIKNNHMLRAYYEVMPSKRPQSSIYSDFPNRQYCLEYEQTNILLIGDVSGSQYTPGHEDGVAACLDTILLSIRGRTGL